PAPRAGTPAESHALLARGFTRASSSGSVAHEHPVRAANEAEMAVPREVAHHERLYPGPVAVDAPESVHERNMIVSGARPDEVVAVARVDPIVPGAAVPVVALARALGAWVRVAPDHVADFAGPDGVVSVAAEQLVVQVLEAPQGAAFVVRVPPVVADRRPPLMAGERESASAQRKPCGHRDGRGARAAREREDGACGLGCHLLT